MTVLFLFHRDLRLIDNTALHTALQFKKSATENEAERIIPTFIFPPEQIDSEKNAYFSHPAVQFMCESLDELNNDLRSVGSQLYTFKGDTLDVLTQIHSHTHFKALYQNRDYSVYAEKRDKAITRWCKEHNVDFRGDYEDYDIIPLKEGLLPDGRPYTNLSQYLHKLETTQKVREPYTRKPKSGDFYHGHISIGSQIPIDDIHTFYEKNDHIKQHGGRKNALKILRRVGEFKNYSKERDFPALDKTTHISAHLHFGTVSIREFYWALHKALGPHNGVIRQLAFRSMYLKVYALYPELQRGVAFRKHIDERIHWKKDPVYWKAWTSGQTGFPLVDAGMKQLLYENWVHNRVRIVVASVATRYLHLDWRDCSKYYYQHLVDADTFNNTAGWGFSSGIGVDAAPFFRPPTNPFIQSKKLDEKAEYIKKWLPELQDVEPKDIHAWGNPKIRAKYPDVKYPAPIIDQKVASHRALEEFKKAAQK
jgi:deoxyribodipyrimidine photo-lyase